MTPTSPAHIVVDADPLNAETVLDALGVPITRSEDFFIRSNFRMPDVDVGAWRLSIGGAVSRPMQLDLARLKQRASREVAVTVECAGNGRTLMHVIPRGTAWNLGAVGTARFRGVRLRDLLEESGASTDAVEVLFRGMDGGSVDGRDGVQFERSLPIADACADDVLIAFEMNGDALPPSHGYPARLVVPGWYGVAWVKWLHSIEVLTEPFRGHFQTDRYVFRDDPEMPQDHPVTRMRVRALLTSHAPGSVIPLAGATLSGIAWSGEAGIDRVEISDDDGATWMRASVSGGAVGLAATWSLDWKPRRGGAVTLIMRATDKNGAQQPLDPVQNTLGYGNNVVQTVTVDVA